MQTLDDTLIAAHETSDFWALVALYEQAADVAPQRDAACFYLTQAYVFALDTNHPARSRIFDRLKAEGRV